ncbi:MAG: hypothetical protein H7A40_00260 [Chlamydiales bacterium]|nr:hypothetical protein [Chlamydiales bacterium]
MKSLIKYAVVALALMICRPAMADETVFEKTIWKIFWVSSPVNVRAVIITEDFDIWFLHGLTPNKLTWCEWIWREHVAQPGNEYFLDRTKWKEGQGISFTYAPWQTREWKDSYRNTTPLLQSCDYLAKNDVYNAHIFAKPFQIDEWMSLYNEIYNYADFCTQRGCYGIAVELLKQLVKFEKFKEQLIKERNKKIEGMSFDAQCVAFDEKYDFCKIAKIKITDLAEVTN